MDKFIQILETNPTALAFFAFLAAVFMVITLAGFALLKMLIQSNSKVASQVLEGQSETDTPGLLKMLVESLAIEVKTNAERTIIIAEQSRAFLTEFKTARDDRELIKTTARQTQDGTLQVLAVVQAQEPKITEIQAATKGGNSMLEIILSKLTLIEGKLAELEGKIAQIPNAIADNLGRDTKEIATQVHEVAKDMKQVLEDTGEQSAS
jgi:hypothetical protein